MTKGFATGMLLALPLTLAHAGGATHWGYTGHSGPEHWAELDPAFQLCAAGRNQSPVDITGGVEADLPALEFHYTGNAGEILNNGHTVQVNFPAGDSLTVDGHRFTLKQVHFHTPSENRIDGRSYPLEAHFVHADDEGNLAVVAVLFEEGEENGTLAKLWSGMPMQAGEAHVLTTATTAADLLPGGHDYYRFNGSLTTPPCSEGVWWQVMKSPLTVSGEQVERFAHAVHGHNNRPMQSHHARLILE